MKTTWSYAHGWIWATGADGRCIAILEASPSFGSLTDMLNVSPVLSALVLANCQTMPRIN